MLKRIFLKALTNRNLKKRILIEPHSYESSRNIGIAVNIRDLNENRFNEMVATLKAEGKKVKILQVDTSSKSKPSEYKVRRADISLFGKIKSDQLNKFLQSKFDLLLVIDQESDYHMEYVTGLCKAGYRIGFNHDPDNKTLDLQIKPEKNRELEDLIRYTKMIHHE